jgi:DNA-binding CsgD family transcriptional regulator
MGMAPPSGVVLALLERASCGAAVCTADGAVVALNDLAGRIFAMMSPPAPATSGEEPARLPAMLMPALAAGNPEPLFLRVPEEGYIAAQAFAEPLGPDGTILLIVADLNLRPHPHMSTLQRAFGLTRREARVASALATGQRLQEIAVAHNVGMGTVRSHLKSIFIKTRTNRQPELVALLARLLPFS